MSTDNPIDFTPAELLYHYLGERIAKDGRESSIENLLADFSQYNQELETIRQLVSEAEASSDRGESKALDLAALMQRVESRWDAKGIAE